MADKGYKGLFVYEDSYAIHLWVSSDKGYSPGRGLGEGVITGLFLGRESRVLVFFLFPNCLTSK